MAALWPRTHQGPEETAAIPFGSRFFSPHPKRHGWACCCGPGIGAGRMEGLRTSMRWGFVVSLPLRSTLFPPPQACDSGPGSPFVLLLKGPCLPSVKLLPSLPAGVLPQPSPERGEEDIWAHLSRWPWDQSWIGSLSCISSGPSMGWGTLSSLYKPSCPRTFTSGL